MNPNLSEMHRRSLIKVPPMLSLLPPSLNIIEEGTCYTKSAKFSKFVSMKIEEAIVYCLATSNRGMRSEQIADIIPALAFGVYCDCIHCYEFIYLRSSKWNGKG